jgi:hypothetical protein
LKARLSETGWGIAEKGEGDIPEPFECDPDEENPFEEPGNFIS